MTQPIHLPTSALWDNVPTGDVAEVVAAVETLLTHFGISHNYETQQQLLVFLECLRVYDERSQVYGQVWRQYGALSNLLSSARKTDRLMEVWWFHTAEYVGDNPEQTMHKDTLDDAIDLINYTTFFIRNARAGNLAGNAPKRPETTNG